MRITRAEKCIIVLTLLFVVFTVGVHLGTRRNTQQVVFSSARTQESAPEISPEQTSVQETDEPELPGRININTADAGELEQLDGIGEKLSQRIVDYREENGPFETEEDIMNVSGIGSAIYARICGSITVGRDETD